MYQTSTNQPVGPTRQGMVRERPRASLKEFLSPSRRTCYYLERITLLQAMQQLRREIRHGRILDVGCGLKPYDSLLTQSGDSYIGTDYPTTMVNSYQVATKADVFATCQSLPFAAESFDTVISTQVLEHVPQPRLLISEAHRVLKPGGILLISAPMTWPLHEEPYDFYRYTIYGLRHLLESARFKIIQEVRRGNTCATLGQLFLDVHLGGHQGGWLAWKAYSSLLGLIVNTACLLLDQLWPNPRLTLGLAIAARKKPPGETGGG
ncbi:MAG: class I SAM-dependent methyltransferase [Chloroflexi bacterium]|nr:class I SAM-dependent methyltransferase [Chloroflexota bacterium]